jgi:hypothetical protein
MINTRTCTICLECFKAPDNLIEFACREHVYHKTCLKEWIKKSNTCPLCKYDLMNDYELYYDSE